ncbi:MAG: hypothetical protein RLZZ15_339 [Verrucomicrobiota bacterium]|jgi:molybdopterin-guanine dinucleotide biosynthesis protein A
MPLPFSAVLLAAGRSTRMGCDKALLEVAHAGGRAPLWRRQRDVLARAGTAEIFLSARADQAWAHAPENAGNFSGVVRDATPDAGPLAGLVAALERATQPHCAVLAIDLAAMEAAWFAALRGDGAAGIGAVGMRATENAGPGAGARGFFEPLAAIYPRELLPAARAALADGRRSLQTLLADAVACGAMRVREISDHEAGWFGNWNAPADLAPRGAAGA